MKAWIADHFHNILIRGPEERLRFCASLFVRPVEFKGLPAQGAGEGFRNLHNDYRRFAPWRPSTGVR